MPYKLHLVLNAKQLVLRVRAGNGAIGQTRDELVTRNIVDVVLGQLIGKRTLDISSGNRQDGLVLVQGGHAVGVGLLRGDDRDLAVVLAAMAGTRVASQLGRVQRGIGAGKGA